MDLRTKAGNNIIRTSSMFIVGFLAVSFIYTVGYHYTIGQEQCETAETLMTAGDYYPGTDRKLPEEVCVGMFTRWKTGLTSPLDNLFFWPISFAGGIVTAAVYLTFFLKQPQKRRRPTQDFGNLDWEGRVNQGQNNQQNRQSRNQRQRSQSQPQQNPPRNNNQQNTSQEREWNRQNR